MLKAFVATLAAIVAGALAVLAFSVTGAPSRHGSRRGVRFPCGSAQRSGRQM
jgi:hypothetical protein